MADRTHYEVIDADPKAAKADLKAAYVAALDAAQAAGDPEEVKAVRRAWQVLSDQVQRDRYDDEIGLHHRGGPGTVVASDSAADDEDTAGAGLTAGDAAAPGESYARTPKEMREQLFHHVPEFLEQPTLGRRMTASLIDAVTTVAVFLVSITVTYQITGADTGGTGLAIFVAWAEFWIVALFVVPTYRTGQTLGKRMTYVMTVDRETGSLVSAAQVTRRYMVPMVALALLPGYGPILALFFGLSYAMGRDQLSLADRLARTAVVVARYRPTRPDPAG
ncbi:MAG: RDD family protein [Actinomycetota bacterium]